MIKYLVMDVDGTLTDGKIYIGENGEIMKAFNAKDGMGISKIAKDNSITPIILTGRKSKIVENRCLELGITELYQGINDKVAKIKEILDDLGEVAYIGDDLNDLPVMIAVQSSGGIIGSPSDAAEEVKRICDYCCKARGGEGCVREFIEWIVFGNG